VLKVDLVVSANGKIVTSDSELVIQPVEMSVVRSITVRMGQQVKAGDVLATLDPTFTQADRDELAAKSRTLNATFGRLSAEIAGGLYDPPDPNPDELTQCDVFRKRHEEFTAKLSAAERKVEQYRAELLARRAETKSLQEQIRLGSEAEEIYQQLVAKDLASKLKLIEASQTSSTRGRGLRPISATSRSSSSRSPAPRRSATGSSRNGNANWPRRWRRLAPTATPQRRGCRRRSCGASSR